MYDKINIEYSDVELCIKQQLSDFSLHESETIKKIYEENNLGIRIFLTSGNNIRCHFNEQSTNLYAEQISDCLSKITLPKLCWNVEIYDINNEDEVIGFCILDTTSSHNDISQMIMQVLPENICYYDDEEMLSKKIDVNSFSKLQRFNKNLSCINNS